MLPPYKLRETKAIRPTDRRKKNVEERAYRKTEQSETRLPSLFQPQQN